MNNHWILLFFSILFRYPLAASGSPAGVQYRTKNGYACETWGSGVAASYTSTTYSNLVGANNYCRNPYLATCFAGEEKAVKGGGIHIPYAKELLKVYQPHDSHKSCCLLFFRGASTWVI
jgi:hypothetical protein